MEEALPLAVQHATAGAVDGGGGREAHIRQIGNEAEAFVTDGLGLEEGLRVRRPRGPGAGIHHGDGGVLGGGEGRCVGDETAPIRSGYDPAFGFQFAVGGDGGGAVHAQAFREGARAGQGIAGLDAAFADAFPTARTIWR